MKEAPITTKIYFTYMFTSLVVMLSLMPAVYDFGSVNGWGKAGLMLCSLVGLGYIALLVWKVSHGKNVHLLVCIVISASMVVLGSLHYIDFSLWGEKQTLLTYSLLSVWIVSIMCLSVKLCGGVTKDRGVQAVLIVAFITTVLGVTLFLVDIAFGEMFIKIGLGFVYVYTLLCIVEAYLFSKPLLHAKKYEGSILLAKIILLALAIFTLPLYVRWCGLPESYYDIFVQIYACVIGGIITLAGVAWTINNQDRTRREDLRIQNELHLKILQSYDRDKHKNREIFDVEFANDNGEKIEGKDTLLLLYNLTGKTCPQFVLTCEHEGKEYYSINNHSHYFEDKVVLMLYLGLPTDCQSVRIYYQDINGVVYYMDIDLGSMQSTTPTMLRDSILVEKYKKIKDK